MDEAHLLFSLIEGRGADFIEQEVFREGFGTNLAKLRKTGVLLHKLEEVWRE